MKSEILFHGAKGDRILGIIESGSMVPSDGKVYFSKFRWQDSLMHGVDSPRRAAFVIKVKVAIPEGAVTYLAETPGVPVTLVVETTKPLPAEVMELYVRRPTEEGFEVQKVVGAQMIKPYLR